MTSRSGVRSACGSAGPLRLVLDTMGGRRFEAAFPLAGPHRMTVVPRYLPRRPRGRRLIDQPRIFAIKDGVSVLARCGWRRAREEAPAIVLIHGLGGWSGASYMVGTALKAFAAGFHVVRLNMRGCGGSAHLSREPYHAGLTEDLRTVAETLAAEGVPGIYLIGFSLGGNQVLRLLGEIGAGATPIHGACAISAPIDLASASDALHGPRNRLYEWSFLGHLMGLYARWHRLHPSRFPAVPWGRIRSMRGFDDLVAGPCNGFQGAADYYEKASSAPVLQRIAIPALILQSRDDPFVPFEPFTRTPMSEHVALCATERGGHAGFFGRRLPGEDRYWAENRAVEFLSLLSAERRHGAMT